MELIWRLLLAFFFMPLILIVFYYGGVPMVIALSILNLIATFELRKIFIAKGVHVPKLVIPLNFLVFISGTWGGPPTIIASMLIVYFVFTGHDLLHNRLDGSLQRISALFFIMVYAGLFVSSFYNIRQVKPHGQYIIIFLLIVTWITDSAAYFAGRWFGKHREVFLASPKKSVEGFLAAVFFAFIASIAAKLIFPNCLNWIEAILIGFTTSIFGQFGDLVESMIKRDAGMKDSSNLIPGHGGILDRFDSLLASAPVLYVVLRLVYLFSSIEIAGF